MGSRSPSTLRARMSTTFTVSALRQHLSEGNLFVFDEGSHRGTAVAFGR
jgi:hypothetical protein